MENLLETSYTACAVCHGETANEDLQGGLCPTDAAKAPQMHRAFGIAAPAPIIEAVTRKGVDLMDDAYSIRQAIATELASHGPFGTLIPSATYTRLVRRVKYLAGMTGFTTEEIWSDIEIDTDILWDERQGEAV